MEYFEMTSLWLLADGAAAPIWANPMFTMVLPIMVIFYFLFLAPQRRDANQRRDMLASLKANDRVVTVGGIRGVVAKVSRDSDEVVVKVDESSNTKIRFTLNAISRVESAEATDTTPSKK